MFLLTRFKVQDESMYPTLESGDYLIVNKFVRKFSKGDIVVFKHAGKFLVKRIEKIEDGKFFVIGNNTRNSKDSRLFGYIKRESVIGKILFRIGN